MNAAETRAEQLRIIASEVRQWIKENPDSENISVFGRRKQMFDAWLDCLDNAAAAVWSEALREAARCLDQQPVRYSNGYPERSVDWVRMFDECEQTILGRSQTPPTDPKEAA